MPAYQNQSWDRRSYESLCPPAVQSHLQRSPRPEHHPAFGQHTDLLQSARILGRSGGCRLRLKDAEVPEFETVPPDEFGDDLPAELLHHLLDQRVLRAGAFRDAVDQVLLCRCDRSPQGRAAVQLESREQFFQSTAGTSKNKGFVLHRRLSLLPPPLLAGHYESTQQMGARRRGRFRLGALSLPDRGAAVCPPRISLTPESRQRRSGCKVRSGCLWGRLDGLTIVGGDAACPAECQPPKCLLGLRKQPRGRL